jgi:hypothetical protein
LRISSSFAFTSGLCRAGWMKVSPNIFRVSRGPVTNAREIDTFYHESERLIRFLIAIDPAAFRALLDSVARGESFDTALPRHYSARFFDVDALEKEFAPYCAKDATTMATAP